MFERRSFNQRPRLHTSRAIADARSLKDHERYDRRKNVRTTYNLRTRTIGELHVLRLRQRFSFIIHTFIKH